MKTAIRFRNNTGPSLTSSSDSDSETEFSFPESPKSKIVNATIDEDLSHLVSTFSRALVLQATETCETSISHGLTLNEGLKTKKVPTRSPHKKTTMSQIETPFRAIHMQRYLQVSKDGAHISSHYLSQRPKFSCTDFLPVNSSNKALWISQCKSRGLGRQSQAHLFNIPKLFASLPSVQPRLHHHFNLVLKLAECLDESIKHLMHCLKRLLDGVCGEDWNKWGKIIEQTLYTGKLLHEYMCCSQFVQISTGPVGLGASERVLWTRFTVDWKTRRLPLFSQILSAPAPISPMVITMDAIFPQSAKYNLRLPVQRDERVDFDDFDFDTTTRLALTKAMTGENHDGIDYTFLPIWSKKYNEEWKRVARRNNQALQAGRQKKPMNPSPKPKTGLHLLESFQGKWMKDKMTELSSKANRCVALAKNIEDAMAVCREMRVEPKFPAKGIRKPIEAIEFASEKVKKSKKNQSCMSKPATVAEIQCQVEATSAHWKRFQFHVLNVWIERLGLASAAESAVPVHDDSSEQLKQKKDALEGLFNAAFGDLARKELPKLQGFCKPNGSGSTDLLLKTLKDAVEEALSQNKEAIAAQGEKVRHLREQVLARNCCVESSTENHLSEHNESKIIGTQHVKKAHRKIRRK